jgi:molecular chaperone GrpE
MRDLLPVVDNIERAIEAAEKQGDSESLLAGFKLVHQQLLNVLSQHNCVKIEAQGQPFDPQFHAAILQQPSDKIPAHHVLLVAQAGYKLHDRVVRPAQVIISTGPAAN